MRSTFAKIALVGVAACLYLSSNSIQRGTFLQSSDSAFLAYIAKYGKSYLSKEEYEYRRELFEKNMAIIAEHNSQNDVMYTLGTNKFSDMTEYERQSYLGAVRPLPTEEGSEWELEKLEAPHGELLGGGVDWTSYMNSIRDQGSCGSCWAFATIATVEARWTIKHSGQRISLSEQQLVDCSSQN